MYQIEAEEFLDIANHKCSSYSPSYSVIHHILVRRVVCILLSPIRVVQMDINYIVYVECMDLKYVALVL